MNASSGGVSATVPCSEGSATHSKCRRVNSRPEPDFRYRSNRRAVCSEANSIATWRDHGRWREACGQRPAL